ncbi:UNVERIFIED_CONTAM: hypothetical protein RMT77_001047 [Armadillidium vulgare]
MGPKKKGGKEKAKGGAKKVGSGRAQATVDGVPMKSMSRDQLEGHVSRLRNEIDREREERGFVQSELERVQRLWEVASTSLEESRKLLRLKDAEMAESEKEKLTEVRKTKQQTKTVMDECESNVGKLQVESQQTLLRLQEEHLEEKSKLVEERDSLRDQLRHEKSSFLTLFANLKLNHSRELDALRNSFEVKTQQLEAQNDERIQNIQDELDLKRKMELTKLREEKNDYLAKVIENHENEIEAIKKESTEVTKANLRLIKQLRSQLAEQKAEGLQSAQQTAKEEKKKLALIQELNQTKKQLSDAQRLLERYKSTQSNLKTLQSSYKTCQKDNDRLKLEIEELITKAKKIEKERDDLYNSFTDVISDIHRRSQMKSTLLEKRLTEISSELEKKDSVLSEVVKAANLDPVSFGTLSNKFESIVDEKNNIITGLQEEVASIRRLYTELLEKKPSSTKEKPRKIL